MSIIENTTSPAFQLTAVPVSETLLLANMFEIEVECCKRLSAQYMGDLLCLGVNGIG